MTPDNLLAITADEGGEIVSRALALGGRQGAKQPVETSPGMSGVRVQHVGEHDLPGIGMPLPTGESCVFQQLPHAPPCLGKLAMAALQARPHAPEPPPAGGRYVHVPSVFGDLAARLGPSSWVLARGTGGPGAGVATCPPTRTETPSPARCGIRSVM
jgi:hypothetical protein